MLFGLPNQKHPLFDQISYINDISIIVLDRDVAESDEARFICLENRTKTVPGTRVYAVGWGTTDETTKTGNPICCFFSQNKVW